MLWNDLSKNHIKLSDTHANEYDDNYGSPITKSYMDYEEKRIITAINKLSPKDRHTAIDVGCGTGRCSFLLSSFFRNVIGYDFSHMMIEKAKRNALDKDIKNVDFEIRDINLEGFGLHKNNISFLNLAFGMGSFWENLDYMIDECSRILSYSGVLYVTFYNSASFVCQYADSINLGLSALPNINSDQLVVDGIPIPCKYYTINFIEEAFQSKGYEIISITSYPSLLPIVYSDILQDKDTFDFCVSADKMVEQMEKGYYISAILRKQL